MRKATKMVALALAAATSAVLSGQSIAAPQTPGNLAILRVGEGATALSNASTAVFVDQYTPAGVFVNSTAVSTSIPSALTTSGSATSEGALTRSPDGSTLFFAGYNIAPGTASIASSTSATAGRIVGMINGNGDYVAGSITTLFSGNNIRSAIGTSVSGNQYAVGGTSGQVLVNTNTAVSSTVTNSRVLGIVGGNLYFSTGSGTAGIYSIPGLPTATGNTATAVFATGTGSSPYDFAFSPDGTIAYVADDRAITSGGGIQKYTFDGNAWSLAYTLGTGASSTVGTRGLAVDFSGTNPVVYATTAESSANRLIGVIDTGASSTASVLATAATNTAFRGLEFTVVPEPSAALLLPAGGALLAARRRRRQA
jgi:hypothetical protein